MEYLQAFGTGLVKNTIDAYFPDHHALLCPAPVGQLTFSRALHPGNVTFHLSPFKPTLHSWTLYFAPDGQKDGKNLNSYVDNGTVAFVYILSAQQHCAES